MSILVMGSGIILKFGYIFSGPKRVEICSTISAVIFEGWKYIFTSIWKQKQNHLKKVWICLVEQKTPTILLHDYRNELMNFGNKQKKSNLCSIHFSGWLTNSFPSLLPSFILFSSSPKTYFLKLNNSVWHFTREK